MGRDVHISDYLQSLMTWSKRRTNKGDLLSSLYLFFSLFLLGFIIQFMVNQGYGHSVWGGVVVGREPKVSSSKTTANTRHFSTVYSSVILRANLLFAS